MLQTRNFVHSKHDPLQRRGDALRSTQAEMQRLHSHVRKLPNPVPRMPSESRPVSGPCADRRIPANGAVSSNSARRPARYPLYARCLGRLHAGNRRGGRPTCTVMAPILVIRSWGCCPPESLASAPTPDRAPHLDSWRIVSNPPVLIRKPFTTHNNNVYGYSFAAQHRTRSAGPADPCIERHGAMAPFLSHFRFHE